MSIRTDIEGWTSAVDACFRSRNLIPWYAGSRRAMEGADEVTCVKLKREEGSLHGWDIWVCAVRDEAELIISVRLEDNGNKQ